MTAFKKKRKGRLTRQWFLHIFTTDNRQKDINHQLFQMADFGVYAELCCCSVAQSCPTLQPQRMQAARQLPCPLPSPGACSNSCPLSEWCHPTISSPVVPFSCPQSFPASVSFQTSQLFASGGQSIGVSASTSVLPMNTQHWSPLGWTGWISLQSKGLSRVFSNTTVQKHQFFGAQLSGSAGKESACNCLTNFG